MTLQSIRKAMVLMTALVLLSSAAFSETRYDRDLVVKDETRAMKVEGVFKDLIAAYEDEDPQGFLDLVSDDRFRQDYITFTDALYSDFRNYEIHRVDYWVDRVVSDHIKQFLFVKWEKRYETLESGRQNTLSGYSRFLFDEVNGKYLLIELAGNPLFGGSLQEWREETPPISGQTAPVAAATKVTTDPGPVSPGTGTVTTPTESCDNSHLFLCDSGNCGSVGGYWYNSTCNGQPGLPDLEIIDINYDLMGSVSSPEYIFRVRNNGVVASQSTDIRLTQKNNNAVLVEGTVPEIGAGKTQTFSLFGVLYDDIYLEAVVDVNNTLKESHEGNNLFPYEAIPY